MSLLGAWLAAWSRLVMRFAWPTILVSIAAAVAGLWFLGDNLGVNTDTANMISPRLEWRQHFNDYRESFPARDRNLIAIIEASDPRAAERFAQALAAQIRAEPAVFSSVFLAGDGAFFERNGLLYQSLPELEVLTDRLADAQPLLGLVKQDPSGAGVIGVVTQIVTAAGPTARSAALAELYDALARALEAEAAGESAPIDWRALIRVEPAATQAPLLVVQPRLDFERIRPARPAIERLRELETELAERLGIAATLRLTGTLAMEDEELDSVTSSAGLAGVLAVVMVGAVLLWCLRSWRLLLVALATLGIGLIGTACFAAAVVGHLNLLSVAFAVLYVGLGVDFILHIALRVKELLAAGAPMRDAIEATMRGVGASLVICTVTTAAGFYAFIPTSFEGVSELGLISGTGMFISLFASVTLLPALLVGVGSRASLGPYVACPSALVALDDLPARRVVGVTVVLALVGLGSLPWVYFDSNPVNLRDPDTESVRALEALTARNDADLLTMVALASDANQAANWARALAALPEVERVVEVDTLVPDEQSEKLDAIDEIALILGPGFGELAPSTSSGGELRVALGRLREALPANGGAADRAQSRLRAAVDRSIVALDAGRIDAAALDRALLSDLPASLAQLETALTARSFTRADLPEELADRWIDATGRELIEIVPTEDITDNAAADRFVAAVRAVVPNATGLPVVYREAARTVVASFRLALTYAFVLVTLLLLASLRSFKDTVLALVPITVAAVVTAGFTAWLGIPFNFANIIALPLLIGVGVDNAIHIVHRTRSETGPGRTLRTSTSLAVLASGLTTIASFGNLAFSAHRGMASMGTLLTIGMLATMLATLVFLPALLRLRHAT